MGQELSRRSKAIAALESRIKELEATIQRVKDGSVQYGENLVYEIVRLLKGEQP
jgi:hypothetical protein